MATCYENRRSDFEWRALTANLAAHGISLFNSFQDQVCLIAPDGNRELASQSQVEMLVHDESGFTMQFWLSDSTDVEFRVRFEAGYRVIDFYLDGLDYEERIVVCKAFCERVHEMMQADNLIGAFVDFDGATENMDWDQYFLGGYAFEGPSPDYVIVQHGVNSLHADLPEGFVQSDNGNYQMRRRVGSPYTCRL
jgi:hypothetical protein